jgi:uncharacterized protein YozE (UPF0346 family)
MSLISYPCQDEHHEAVRLLLDAFCGIWPDSEFGPMAILIADYNALDHNLTTCRERIQAMLDDAAIPKERDYFSRIHDFAELHAGLYLLDMLALIPEDWRDIHAESIEDDE